jgi:regulator of protease activity HflC (stomatin/prohibitin superfamily)
MNRSVPLLIVLAILGVLSLTIGACMSKTVEPGHASVASVFGEVDDEVYREGWHLANVFADWTDYDCRQRTWQEENVSLPTADQLTSAADVSVQYRADISKVREMLRDTGTLDDVVRVHMVPKLRSLIREAGRSVTTAEELFTEEGQGSFQLQIRDGLAAYCAPKGLIVEDVFLRDITLPQFVREAIESKKTRQQEAERQKAELERFRSEMDQKTVQATAEKLAAEQEALKIKLLADARAYEIEVNGKALKESPDVMNLKAIERWNGIMPNVMGGGDKLLFGIDVNKAGRQ